MLRHLALPLVLLLALPAVGQTPPATKYTLALLSMIRSDSTHGRSDIHASILLTPVEKNDNANRIEETLTRPFND